MGPPPDYLNLLYALENNIQEIYSTSSLDPVIVPVKPTRVCTHTIITYIDFFETADPSKSEEPLVVEYYKLKFKLKSFEEIVDELGGNRSSGLDFFPLDINDFISNGTTSDLYVAPFKVAEQLEDDVQEEALRFFREAQKIAMRWCNQAGVELCTEKVKELQEKMGSDPEEDKRHGRENLVQKGSL